MFPGVGPVDLAVLNARLNRKPSSGRRVGRQAAMMPVNGSVMVQIHATAMASTVLVSVKRLFGVGLVKLACEILRMDQV